MGRTVMLALVATLPVMGAIASPAAAQKANGAAIGLLAEDFIRAQANFDQARIVALTAPDYQEVSPVGDVDRREAVIGFYAPEKKSPAPPMTVSETAVRQFDRFAIVTTKITYRLPGADGQSRDRSMRAVLVARPEGRDWRFVSAQYTPMPPAKPKP